jgi:hypothetical protein
MTRWALPITLFAVVFTVAAVPSASGPEVIRVPPGVPTEKRIASDTEFQPGHSYTIKISGTIEAESERETLVFSAFHCLQGCPDSADHAYYPHLRIYDRSTGAALTPASLNESGQYDDAKYSAAGNYVLTFDKFATETQLEWSADPHGKNPDAYGRYYSGPGFTVEIEEVPGIVPFKFKQAGLPQHPPKTMISSQFQTKGTVELRGTDYRRTVEGDPRGSAAYVAINERKDRLVVFRPVGAHYKELTTPEARALTLSVKVRRSNDPGCDKGSRAVITLLDAVKKKRDVARLRSGPCDYDLDWTRDTSDEFQISVGKPQ